MRIVVTLAALAGIALGGTGCATQEAGGVSVSAATPMPGQVEAVHAAAVAQDQAVFWVSSNGCTQKADLTPVVRETLDGPVLTLRRLREDKCREVQPQGVEMRWSFEELGLAPGSRVSIENPYQVSATATAG